MLGTVRRWTLRFAAAGALSAGAGAYWYRPFPDHSNDNGGPTREGCASVKNLYENGDENDPLTLTLARYIVVPVTVSLSRVYLRYFNDFSIREDENYRNLLKQVFSRQQGKALITVANHRSTLDDPTILGNILPWWANYNPKYIRWNVCTQEICFSTHALGAYFGAGKTLPICRGGGINQKLLLDYMRKVAAGQWCHVFPEAGCWQVNGLGGREGKRADEIGKLKWGVGKLIAHAPEPPVVIPFYHTGMEGIIPQDPVTRDIIAKYPGIGQKVRVIVGEEIEYMDLIRDWEAKHGPRRIHQARAEDEGCNFHEYWDSTPEECSLYSSITLRVQQALEKLSLEAPPLRESSDSVLKR